MTEPIRTCVGCRGRAPARELLRVVVVDGRLVADRRHRLPGRGAWIHPRAGCLAAAHRRRSWARALRVAGPIETEDLDRQVAGSGAEVG